ncbi:hypothetical protein ONZ51_g1032 [Trametes cubensis]|uniref:Uncharacterized protein n=1 Tax=Trametes cubensis TaxID=1111947 RepID=A0AAD7XG78_9APHY|nr:hypothetical protein ONZ51_g1032 [Trametes cubensis]
MNGPYLQRNPQIISALRDSVSAPSLSFDPDTPSDVSTGDGVVIYYDSMRPTDDVHMPHGPTRSVMTRPHQPVREPAQMQMRARAHSVGSQPRSTAPLSRRPLVRAVGKATGKIVRLVIRSPLRQRHGRTHGSAEVAPLSRALSTSTSGDWRERARASGASLLIESDTDTVNDQNNESHSFVMQVIQPCESTSTVETVETPDGACLYVSPPNPHNSEVSILEPYVPPDIDEETAYQLITLFHHGQMLLNGDAEPTTQTPTPDESDATTGTPTPTRDSARDRHHHHHHHYRARGRKMHAPVPTPPAPMLTKCVHIVLFFPCASRSGAGSSAGPLRGACAGSGTGSGSAYEHAFIFLACAVVLAYYHPYIGCTLLWAVLTRFAAFWVRFFPKDGLWERIGENDVESLWLIGQGQAVIDAAFAKQCNCVTLCECHGLCPLRCPDHQDDM